MHQTGLDTTVVLDAFVLNAEAVLRLHDMQKQPAQTSWAAGGGVEHTSYALFASEADLTLALEYVWDQRPAGTSTTLYDNDAFAAARLAFNDPAGTEVLAAAVVDIATGFTSGRVQAKRRLDEHWQLAATLHGFFVPFDAAEWWLEKDS